MGQKPFWGAYSRSRSLEILSLSSDPKVHYRVHEPTAGPCPEPAESSPQPHILFILRVFQVYTPVRFILIPYTHLPLCRPARIFPSGFPIKIVYFVPHQFIGLHFITLIIFGAEYISWSSSLCNFLHPVTSSLITWNISFSNLFSDTPSIYVRTS
jgi:hypothetical protein